MPVQECIRNISMRLIKRVREAYRMNWEFDILYALQGIHGPVLDRVMVFLSALGNAGILWISLSLILCIPLT